MAHRDSTTASGTTLSPAVAVPAGAAIGDIATLKIDYDNSSGTMTWPTGFTEFADLKCTADGGTCAAAWKRLTAADSGNYTATINGISAPDWVMQASLYSGRHATDPPVASTAEQDTAQSSPVSINAAAVTAVTGDDLEWISGPDVTAIGIGNLHTPPTDYVEREDAENAWANLSVATRDNVSAGSTGTVTGTFALTSGTSGWGAFLIRIPAAAGGGGTVTKGRQALLGVGM